MTRQPLQDEAEPTTNALNMTEPPKGLSEKRIDEFTITTDLANGRLFFVEGEAIERFAGMTNWDYYEAQLRFQKVLEASGAGLAQSRLAAHMLTRQLIAVWRRLQCLMCTCWQCYCTQAHGRVLRQHGS